MTFKSLSQLVGLLFLACVHCEVFSQDALVADTVLVGGRVLTMDAGDRGVQAVAIAGGRIIGAGTDQEVMLVVGADTQVIRLNGTLKLCVVKRCQDGLPPSLFPFTAEEPAAKLRRLLGKPFKTSPIADTDPRSLGSIFKSAGCLSLLIVVICGCSVRSTNPILKVLTVVTFYRASFAVIFVVLLSHRLANAGNFVLTIGGGYSPAGNQASLERNVLLFQRVVAGHSDGVDRHDIFFADGGNAGKDLQVHDPSQVPLPNRLMAEFFGSTRDLGLTYRNHRVPDVRNASKPANVRAWFAEVGPQMKDGDKLTIYVTAHGHRSRDRDREYNTSIAMWGNSTLQMTEFARLLDGLDPGVDVVMVMVQCYTGGFSHLMYRGGDPSNGLSLQKRVGFYATVHDRPAAGCTPSVDEASYVEYSTYFWAAIAGTDRSGKPIDAPDYDKDGRVSLEEAHAYTILHANTIDVPVKTSGEYLSETSKFGDGTGDLLQNDEPYSLVLQYALPVQKVLLTKLSEKLKLDGENRLVDAWQKTRVDRRRRRGPTQSSSGVKNEIAADLKKRWPGLANTMNPVSIELLTTRQQEFVDAVQNHPQYRKHKQESDQRQSRPDEQQTRVQFERFLRVADNVILAENLRRMNKPERVKEYQQIIAAERDVFLSP
jgi:hypothetical protein